MKKSLIALAVAGVVSAPAFAATSNVDVYGIMNIAVQDTNGDDNNMDVVDNASRIGFKGSEDLGGGLKAIWQIEQQINATGAGTNNISATSTSSGGITTTTTGTVADGAFGGAGLRNTFVGLSGGFGTALIGRHDTPYKMATGKYDIFADTIGDYNGRSMNGALVDPLNATHDARANNAIAYVSPNFSGLTVAAAIVTSMDHLNSVGDTVDATSLAAMYANGPLTVDFGWQDVKAVADGSTAWKLGLGYSFGDAKVGFVYEDIDNDTGADRDSFLLNGTYGMGPIVLKAMYGRVDVDGGDTPDVWVVGADYNLSKRTAVYFVYADNDMDNNAVDNGKGFNLGVKHSF